MKTDLGFVIKGPLVTEDEVDAVCSFLADHGWVQARDIAGIGLNDRKLRAIASASRGRILSGQKGYRLFDRSTPLAEADLAAGWLESQAREMLRRASEIRRRFHEYARKGAA